MPRRKVNGVQVQRNVIALKTSNCLQLKKTGVDAKPVDNDHVMKPAEAEPVRLDTDSSYLHKKFKKIADISDFNAKTEPKVNGNLDNNHHAVVPKSGEEDSASSPGRYVCPYCQLVCAKPSVLQKHVRAHTNERPYPCTPCGFAFKTKSNLYKHCRSQSHRIKTGSTEAFDSSEGSDDSSSNPADTDSESQRLDPQPRIYKPKFHKAALYQDDGSTETEEQREKPKLSSPDSELLQQRISKIIRDNQVIFETMEPQFSKKFMQRQSSRDKESSSPRPESDPRRNHDAKSKLALALMKVDRSFSPSYPKVNSEYPTYQPLNLTKKQSGGSMIKEILIASRESERTPERMAEFLCNLGTKRPNSDAEPSRRSASPPDVGPLLGNTPLVDSPTIKKRRVQSTTVPPDPRTLLPRRLSTSSLPSTLQSLEELSRHPMKPAPMHMFGGEVKILDCGEPKTVRIQNAPSPQGSASEDTIVVTVAKPGLLSSGGTLHSTTSSSAATPSFLSPDTSAIALAPNVAQPDLAVPGVPQPNSCGLLTIRHGDRQIPHVPGMPGPHTDAKPNVSSVNAAFRKISSSSSPTTTISVPKIEISSPIEESGRKFLRPTSLPLKPGSFTPKRLHQGTTPTVLSLVSPETPRPKKSYGQLFLNGHAYTYLGLKCSTKSYYCTISRPQPMYVVQSPQLNRLSMYSNWKVYSETDSLGLTPGQAMAQYDSRYRTGGFTTAKTSDPSTGITTHSSTWQADRRKVSEFQEENHAEQKRQVCSGGYESTENYTYIRGRGRGKYVCEECGIRCKKPSMLKKHIRSHSDVRPFYCKQCVFAFKTKGNLTKHMKSKAHSKKCSELGIEPTPLSLSDIEGDVEDELDSGGSDSDSEMDSDDDADFDEMTDGADALEREAACSLLSLSATPRVSQCVAAGLLPKASSDFRPSCYPYTTAQLKNAEVQTEVDQPFEETPMDLSQKESNSMPSGSVPAYLLASIRSEEEKSVDPPGGQMLQAYLTAKALRDVRMKQQHQDVARSPEREPTPEPVTPTAAAGTPTAPVIINLPASMQNEMNNTRPNSPPRLLSKVMNNLKAEFFPPASGPNHSYVSVTEDGRNICVICNKTFTKPSQLRLHVNIHYFERPYRCEACGVSFRTKGHLQKHERSVSHHNKVSMNTTFGAATTTNPRPFKCDDCKSAFRIHGHLAKHLRSKLHIMKLECIGKLPFGTYAELERSGYNLNEIDTTDCENSLESLQVLAQKMYEKDSSKFGQMPVTPCGDAEDENSSDGAIPDVLQCSLCTETCDSPTALQVHMFAEHNRETVLDKRKAEGVAVAE